MRPKGSKDKIPRQTLKRQRLLKEIKNKSNRSLKQAAIKAGYHATTKTIYSKTTKDYLRYYLELTGNDLKTLEKKYELIEAMALNANEYNTAKGCVDSRVRMQGGFKDRSESTVTLKTDEEVKTLEKYKDRFNQPSKINAN